MTLAISSTSIKLFPPKGKELGYLQKMGERVRAYFPISSIIQKSLNNFTSNSLQRSLHLATFTSLHLGSYCHLSYFPSFKIFWFLTEAGQMKVNGSNTKSCLSRVFNIKLGCFCHGCNKALSASV
jgi:hypothetical protein